MIDNSARHRGLLVLLTLILVPGLLVGTALAGGETTPRPTPTPPPSLAVGDTVPPFEAQGLDGEIHRLSFPAGRRTVLLFFMASCPSCHRMIPEWNREFENRSQDLQVVGVLMDREPPGFFMAMPISFPVVRAPDRVFMREHYKVYRVPLTLRVGPDGKVEGLGKGMVDGIRLGELFRPGSS